MFLHILFLLTGLTVGWYAKVLYAKVAIKIRRATTETATDPEPQEPEGLLYRDVSPDGEDFLQDITLEDFTENSELLHALIQSARTESYEFSRLPGGPVMRFADWAKTQVSDAWRPYLTHDAVRFEWASKDSRPLLGSSTLKEKARAAASLISYSTDKPVVFERIISNDTYERVVYAMEVSSSGAAKVTKRVSCFITFDIDRVSDIFSGEFDRSWTVFAKATD